MDQDSRDYSIFIRSTGERVPVTKEEFKAYYHDIDLYRRKQQKHGSCSCPQSRWSDCDMDCFTCPFRCAGDSLSLDCSNESSDDNALTWVDLLVSSEPLIEDITADISEMNCLLNRLSELVPEAVTVGKLRIDGKSDSEIAEMIGIHRTTFLSRLNKAKSILKKEFPDFF